MDLIKYCKAEHNIQEGCNTIQLGTFDYYRELDPQFSIADSQEGFIQYSCEPSEDLLLDSRHFNAITGGGVRLTDKDSPSYSIHESLGSVNFKAEGSEFIGQQDGSTKIKPGKMEVEVYYPNCYIFCASIFEAGQEPNPASISTEYNSYYKIKSNSIDAFANSMCQFIRDKILIGDIKLEDQRILDSHILTLGQSFNVRCIHGDVNYLEDKVKKLTKPDDFLENHWMKIFLGSMLEKHYDYRSDREYRFVFFIEHPTHKILPVKKHPKLIELNPVANFMSV